MTGAGRLFIFLYTDEDVTDRLAPLLRDRGYEAESALKVGTTGWTDEEQLAFASSRGWTLLTYNRRDFSTLARQWQDIGRSHAGIILSRQFSNRQTGELLRQVCRLIDSVPADEMGNTVRNLQSTLPASE
jgi:predicted nuclease of predicted toxin-antitoxin system